MTKQLQRRRVSPVRVLDHQEDRLSRARSREQVADRHVETKALGVGIRRDWFGQPIDQSRQVGDQPDQLPAVAEGGTQDIDIGVVQELAERLDEGSVGRAHRRVAGAVEDEDALPGGLGRKLARQAALTHSCLAHDKGDAATLPFGPRQQRAELLQLRAAPDERIGGARAWPARASRHLGSHSRKIVRSDHRNPNSAKRSGEKWVRSGHDTCHQRS